MCKKIGIILGCLMFLFSSGSALAGKPTETTIYHCGCDVFFNNTDTAYTEMNWRKITVSPRAKGHINHMYNSDPEAADTADAFCMYTKLVGEVLTPMADPHKRLHDDCRVNGDGDTPLGNGLALCSYDDGDEPLALIPVPLEELGEPCSMFIEPDPE